MDVGIIKMVNAYVYNHYPNEYFCVNYFRDSMMSREDLVGEILLYIYQKIDKYDDSRGKLSTFVYALCRTKCLAILRKNKNNRIIESLDRTIDSDCKVTYYDLIASDEDLKSKLIEEECLCTALAELDAITLSYFFDGKKQRELAEEEGKTQCYISRTIRKNIDDLRVLIDK